MTLAKRAGFTLVEFSELPEIRCWGGLWRHDRTGAEVLSMVSDDENKVFGVTLRTPPEDSTGLPHILEHSVLCGSEKYPVKEPFVELMKGSLQTFLNAFTYPDKTCYPVAGTNLQDFYNLVDVYIDAVFFPRIDRFTLMQEGVHIAAESPQGPFQFKGVVFNEMKGAYSSPEGRLAEACQQAIFPDGPYGVDSGGDPERIPDLTFEQFLAFHKRFYHPGNARFYFYGDDPEDARFEKLAALLDRFGPPERIASAVPSQRRFTKPVMVEKTYAVDDPEDAHSLFSVNWLLPELHSGDDGLFRMLLLDMLENILVGAASSPLRKALIDSELGEDLTHTGLELDLKAPVFSVGLKGIERSDVEEAQALIDRTLAELAADGPSAELVEAALNTIEFDLRENNTGRFPRGLSLMLKALAFWLHDKSPFAPLAFDEPLARIKAIPDLQGLFAEMIRKLLIDNRHKALVILNPDPGLAEALDARFAARIEAEIAALDEAGLARLAEDAQELHRRQSAPDSPEALASIPRLAVADIKRENTLIPCEAIPCGDGEILFHDIETDGVAYLDLALDFDGLPAALIPHLPLFARALFETGAGEEDFPQFLTRINRKTGGVYATVVNTTARDGEGNVRRLVVRGKAVGDKIPDLLSIIEAGLTAAHLHDSDRIRQMLSEDKADAEMHAVTAGHSLALSRIRARLEPSGAVDELLGGASRLLFLKSLADDFEARSGEVVAAFAAIRDHVVSGTGATANLTMNRTLFDQMRPGAEALLRRLPKRPTSTTPVAVCEFPAAEGLSVPSQVNYVGKGFNLHAAGYRYHGSAGAVVKRLRTGPLWDEVRVKGGAYGAFASYDRNTGTFAAVSYRDPNIENTLSVFDGLGEALLSETLDKPELDKSIIGAINELDAHLLPDAKGWASLVRRLTGEDDDFRQKVRDELLATTPEDFKRFGEALRSMAKSGAVSVVGSAERLKKAGLDGDAVLKLV